MPRKKVYFVANGTNVELILREDNHETNQQFKNGEVNGTFCVFADTPMFHSQGVGDRFVYVMDYSELLLAIVLYTAV